eukprot:4548233-Prymnesium_polylepis.1
MLHRHTATRRAAPHHAAPHHANGPPVHHRSRRTRRPAAPFGLVSARGRDCEGVPLPPEGRRQIGRTRRARAAALHEARRCRFGAGA